MKKWLIGGAVVGTWLVVLLVSGVVVTALAKESTPATSVQEVPLAAPAQETVITPEEAKAAAEAAYPGATAIEVELEKENGTLAYEVELDNGLEVLVDPSDGTILGGDADEPGDVDVGGDVEDADGSVDD